MSTLNFGDKLSDHTLSITAGLVFEYEGEHHEIQKTTRTKIHTIHLRDKSLWCFYYKTIIYYATFVCFHDIQQERRDRGEAIINNANPGDVLVWKTRKESHSIMIFHRTDIKTRRGESHKTAIGFDPFTNGKWTIYAGAIVENLGPKAGAFISKRGKKFREQENERTSTVLAEAEEAAKK